MKESWTVPVESPDPQQDAAFIPVQNNHVWPADSTPYTPPEEDIELAPDSDLPSDPEKQFPQETPDKHDLKDVESAALVEADPWALAEQTDTGIPWSELTNGQRVVRVLLYVVKIVLVLGFLLLFIVSLDLLGSSFQLVGGRTAGSALTNSELLENPVCGLMIGVLITVLLQSSSTSTSITVTMVSANLLQVKQAIPIMMGANIGTSVTNTIVSLGQSVDRTEFRRAFAGATVHDMFNWLTVIIILPIESIVNIVADGGVLFHMTKEMVEDIEGNPDSDEPQFLKVITKPITNAIIQIDSSVVTAIAVGSDTVKRPLIKYWCSEVNFDVNITENVNSSFVAQIHERIWTEDVVWTNTSFSYTDVNETASETCSFLFEGQGLPDADLSEAAVGAILLVLSLVLLMVCLVSMVKILQSLLKGPLIKVVHKVLNADFPGKLAFLTGYVAIFVGAGMTILVQSSSVFTSAVTPLVGMGVITVERMYPLTLGSNIGTTVTGILAAFTSNPDRIQESLQIALVHLFFNIFGILMFYPIPVLRRVPIRAAKTLGDVTSRYRWFPIVYLLGMFFFLPGIVFGLSLAGWEVLVAVLIPVVLIVIFIIVVNVMQGRNPERLPVVLQTWDFLPLPLRSLEPYDRVFGFCSRKCPCSCCGNSSSIDAVSPENEVPSEVLGVSAPRGDVEMTNKPVANGHHKQEVQSDAETSYDNKAFHS